MLIVSAVWAATLYTGAKSGAKSDAKSDAKPDAASTAPETYQNPVFEPVLADPSVLRAEDGYIYAYGTEDDWADGEGVRVVPVLRSKNMAAWEYVGEAFETKPSWKPGGVWAPDVSYFNGMYYMYYTMSIWGDDNPGIGLAVADSPAGPFEDLGKLFDSDEIGAYSIDPMLIVEESVPYLFFGSIEAGIYGIELTEDGTATVGEKFQISAPGYEAPYIFKKDGYFYFFGSAGTCCDGADSTYRVETARAESIKGPYVNKEGVDIRYAPGSLVLSGYFPPELGKGLYVGPGHNSVITDDEGQDWMVYHAIAVDYPKFGNGVTRRPLMIDPIRWEDGWPVITDALPSLEPMKAPVFRDR